MANIGATAVKALTSNVYKLAVGTVLVRIIWVSLS